MPDDFEDLAVADKRVVRALSLPPPVVPACSPHNDPANHKLGPDTKFNRPDWFQVTCRACGLTIGWRPK